MGLCDRRKMAKQFPHNQAGEADSSGMGWRSEDQSLVNNNLGRILNSASYRLAHADEALLESEEMRGVRMLLEITKPQQILDAEGVESTIIIFGGVNIIERSEAEKRLAEAEAAVAQAPLNHGLQRQLKRCRSQLDFSTYYEAAREFTRLVSQDQQDGHHSHVVVTGGGPGIMEAANRGAFDAGGRSIGLSIKLPGEPEPNPYVTPELCFQFNYFALRKIHFVMRSAAAVLFPGGFGTLDELFEVLTLRQTAIKRPMPVILFGREFWSRLIDFDYLADCGLIRDEHLALFEFADTPEEAWQWIRSFEAERASDDGDDALAA